MDAKRQALVDRIQALPEDILDEVAAIFDEILGSHLQGGLYEATPEELEGIDRGIAAADRGEFATPEQVEAELRKFRRPR
jgi:predicted transcriptional regulator